jgi:hypothetical protein
MPRRNKGDKGSSFTLSPFEGFSPVSYVFGRVQHFIEVYAAGNQLPPEQLAEGLAALLLATSSREVLGTINHMPALRGSSPKLDSSPRKVAVASNSHRQAQVRSNAPTATTALEILKETNKPRRIPDVAREMMRRNSNIASMDAASQCLYHMRKRKELTSNRKGEVKLAA